MLTRKELLRQKAGLVADLKAKDAEISAADETGAETEALVAEFDALKSKLVKIKAAIARKESLEDEVEDETKDLDEDEDKEDDEDEAEPKARKSKKSLNAPRVIRQRSKLASPAERYGAMLWGKAAAKHLGAGHAYNAIVKTWNDESVAKAAVGAVDTTEPTIVQDAAAEMIGLLNTSSVVRAAGARVVPMPQGNKTIFRQRLGSTAAYMSEGSQPGISKVGFDTIQMSWHKMGALVYITKEELRFPAIDTGAVIVNDMVTRLGLKEDITFLTSTGSGGTPKGILSSVNASNLIASTVNGDSAVDWQTIANDLASLESVVSGNLVGGPYVLFMNENVKTFLKAITNGFTFPFRDELSGPNPTLNGHRVFTTQQLATNAGTGTNESKIILAQPKHLIVGDAIQYDVEFSDQGSLVDDGVQVNLFSEGKAAFLATMSNDFAIEHDVSAAVLTAKNWTTTAGRVAGRDTYVQSKNTAGSSASST